MIWLRRIFYSWDIWLAILLAMACYYIYGPSVDNDFAKDMYNMGVSVLAIIFSVYFAALAIIISSGDNDFIEYLEARGHYSALIGAFRFSLMLLFCALLLSAIAFSWTSHSISQGGVSQTPFIFTFFVFLFSYSVFATVGSSMDTINYSEARITFLKIRKRQPLKTAVTGSINAHTDQKGKTSGTIDDDKKAS